MHVLTAKVRSLASANFNRQRAENSVTSLSPDGGGRSPVPHVEKEQKEENDCKKYASHMHLERAVPFPLDLSCEA